MYKKSKFSLPYFSPFHSNFLQPLRNPLKESTAENESLQQFLCGEQRLNADLADPGAYLEGRSIRASVIIVVIRRVTTVPFVFFAFRLWIPGHGPLGSLLARVSRFEGKKWEQRSVISDRVISIATLPGWSPTLARIPSSLHPAYQFWKR